MCFISSILEQAGGLQDEKDQRRTVKSGSAGLYLTLFKVVLLPVAIQF